MEKCFVIMPLSEKYDDLYYRVKKYLYDNFSIEVTRAGESFLSRPIIDEIKNSIANSEYIICIIGDNSNANVFYELGIAHQIKDISTVLILKESIEKYKFDIAHIRQKDFSLEQISDIDGILKGFINDSREANSYNYILKESHYFKNSNDKINIFLSFYNNTYISSYKDNIKYVRKNENEAKEIISSLNYLLFLMDSHYQNDIFSHGFYEVFKIIFFVNYDKIMKNVDDFDVKIFKLQVSDDIKYDFAIFLIDNNLLINYAVEWCLSYFTLEGKYRLDFIRFKIEMSLVETKNENINGYLINGLYSVEAHIREYCAEIIRCRKMKNALVDLIKQLSNEKYPYSARSMIDAIGELSDKNNADAIKAVNGIKKIIDTNNKDNSFLLKHIENAILKIKTC